MRLKRGRRTAADLRWTKDCEIIFSGGTTGW
jgi:hypothetical protein